MLLSNSAYTLQHYNAVSDNLKIIKKAVKILGVHFIYDLRAKKKMLMNYIGPLNKGFAFGGGGIWPLSEKF